MVDAAAPSRPPAAGTHSNRGTGRDKELWLRIAAFLSCKSPNTQRTYRSILVEWCHFLGGTFGSPSLVEPFITADELHAAAYLQQLTKQAGQKPRFQSTPAAPGRGSAGREDLHPAGVQKQRRAREGLQSTLANATIAKKFAVLRRIYKMLVTHRLAAQNPFDSDAISAPRAGSGQKRPTEMVDFELVRPVLEAPDAASPTGVRDRAILAVLFGGGLRRSEVVKVRVGDVRRTRQGTCYLRLRSTKAGKDVDQALPPWAGEAVAALLAQRANQKALRGDYLFVSYRGPGARSATNQPISDSGIYKLFKTYCRKAGVAAFVSPHSARATAITRLLDAGISHREVQEFSRHASVQMVELYDKRRIGIDQNPARKLKY